MSAAAAALNSSLPLAVTMGDPAGIGLDIVLRAWADRAHRPLPPFVLYADPASVRSRLDQRGAGATPISILEDAPPLVPAQPDALTIVPIRLAEAAVPGRPSARNGGAIIAAIEAATRAVAEGKAAAVVTNPISKEVLYAAGFSHPGHTEFLGELARRYWPGASAQPVMMLAADDLRVVPVTVHIPLAAVPGALTTDLILTTARITAADLRRFWGIERARLAVAGLNPHAGEGGTIGREDLDIIAPAVARLRAEGYDITGPLSADTMFHPAARARYDAALCMYHDQALIPIKTLAFDRGVNVTLGLPFVRTSPDHGTAFDIAGSGLASAVSFVEALLLARKLADRRPSSPA